MLDVKGIRGGPVAVDSYETLFDQIETERTARMKAEAEAAVLRHALEGLLNDHPRHCAPGTTTCEHYTVARSALHTTVAGRRLLEALLAARTAVGAAAPCLEDWVRATRGGRIFKRDAQALSLLSVASARLHVV